MFLPHERKLFAGSESSRRVLSRNGFRVFRLKIPRATTLFESRLAARHVVTAVGEKHFENCFSPSPPYQKLFNTQKGFYALHDLENPDFLPFGKPSGM